MRHRSLADYASFINSQLRAAGYEAYFVGGCVRDLLLGRDPKDYDIATSASPAAVQAMFPGSDLVGAHFGVVLVRDEEWQVEVATFRSDGDYSDGRRPDSVQFVGDVRRDVERRDFTINALLLDPGTHEVLDFVGGRADLEAGIIRAIGDPLLRFGEDHLRLLRAVRFAARFHFTIEDRTMCAMRQSATLLATVAAERVRDELNRILMEGGAAYGLELLRSSGLAESLGLPITGRATERLQQRPSTTAVAWAALLLDSPTDILSRLRLSSRELQTIHTLIDQHGRMNRPFDSLAEMKRFLRQESFPEQMSLHRMDGLPEPVLPELKKDDLHPTPLLTGTDLLALGVPQGPLFAKLLREAEDRQLNGEMTSRSQALDWLAYRYSACR